MPSDTAPSWNDICMATIDKLYKDDDLRGEFMKHAKRVEHGNATSEAEFAAFMKGPKMGLPANLADELARKHGEPLFKFVGQYVCQYLW